MLKQKQKPEVPGSGIRKFSIHIIKVQKAEEKNKTENIERNNNWWKLSRYGDKNAGRNIKLSSHAEKDLENQLKKKIEYPPIH